MSIGLWILLGVLVACCVVPMLLMGRRGKHGNGGKEKDSGPQNP